MSTASDRTAQLKYQCLAANNWSLYPAKKDVDMGCKSITNLLSETFCDGTYVGPGASFDISSNHHIVLKTTDRISFSAGGVSNVLDISSGGIKPTQILDTSDAIGNPNDYLVKNGAGTLTWINIPPNPSSWQGIATTELDMNGFKIVNNAGPSPLILEAALGNIELAALGNINLDSAAGMNLTSTGIGDIIITSAQNINLDSGGSSISVGSTGITTTPATGIVDIKASVSANNPTLQLTNVDTSISASLDYDSFSVNLRAPDVPLYLQYLNGSGTTTNSLIVGANSINVNISDGGGGSSVVEFGLGSITLKSDFGVGAPVLTLFDTGSGNGGSIDYGINALNIANNAGPITLYATDINATATTGSVNITTNSADTTISMSVNNGKASMILTDVAGVGSIDISAADIINLAVGLPRLMADSSLIKLGIGAGGGLANVEITTDGDTLVSGDNSVTLRSANLMMPTIPSATKSEILYYDTASKAVSYGSPFPAITVQAVGAAIELTPAMNRSTYILTGASAAAQNFTTAGLVGTAAGWCVYVRNGNNTAVNLAVTINGAGSQVLRGTSASSNSGFILLYWNGTALTQYI
jgi:hypothetical protein